MNVERVAVLGAGPGGLAAAAVLARRGLDVRVFNRSSERIAPVAAAGGVRIEGDLGEDFVPLPIVTTDIALAVADVDLVLCSTPAYGQAPMAQLVASHMRPGMAFVLACGSAGTLEVAQIFRDSGIDVLEDVLIGETISLPQSARMTGDAELRIRLPSTVRLAAFPARNTAALSEFVGDLIKHRVAPNVFDTGLNNVNFLIHPGPMLLNYAAVERADGYLSLMNEGMTPGVLRLMDALDAEKQAVVEAYGLRPATIDELYVELGSGPHVYRSSGEPFGLRDRIWARYITEDVPYGAVLIASLGELAGVPVPLWRGIVDLFEALDGADYATNGRTADRLGLAGLTVAEVNEFLEKGWS